MIFSYVHLHFCPKLVFQQQRAENPTHKHISEKLFSLLIMNSKQYLNTLFKTSCFIHCQRRRGITNGVGGTESGQYGAVWGKEKR